MKFLTKKDIYDIVFMGFIFASWYVMVDIFIGIFRFGEVIRNEPNNFVLYGELFLLFIFGVLIFFRVVEWINDRCVEDKKGVKQ